VIFAGSKDAPMFDCGFAYGCHGDGGQKACETACEAMFLIWIWLEKAKDNPSDEYAECTRYNYCSKVETGEGREVNRVQ
jgi:hypothetical protein